MCQLFTVRKSSLGNPVMLHLDCFLTSLFENSIHGWSHTKQEGGAATDILLLASAPVDLVFRNRVDGLGTEPLVSGHTFPSRHVAGSCYYQRYFASISSHGFQLFLDPFESVTDKLVVPQ